MKRFLIIFIIILSACSNSSTSSELIALNLLENNPNEDLFMFNDRVYTKDEELVEVDSVELIEVGEITAEYEGTQPFKNGMANKLAEGTPIFSIDEEKTTDYLYLKLNDHYIQYMAEPEG